MLADLIVLGIIVLSVIMGYRSGLVKTCINAASYVVSIIVSLILYPILSNALLKTQLHDVVLESVAENIVGSGETTAGTFAGYVEEGANVVAAGAAGTIATLIINVIAFIIVVILCKLLMAVLANVLDIFARIQVIRQINGLGGMVVGFVLGVVIIYLVLAVIFACTPMLVDTYALEQIEDSILALWMYENNVLVSLVGTFIG